jgi:DNA polymerase-3 subunit gamma/tau
MPQKFELVVTRSNMSFYHKYRPQKFSDLMGQEHVKKTLTNAISYGKVGHAYLFSGPRGAGKTTVARLLAKSLNCKENSNKKTDSTLEKQTNSFEPCNKCISCQEITIGQSLDVIEIDAASNRGIDEIRELRDKIKFAPSKSVYKVFIIDEVHMLTKEAFNALLKTLEEPPKHAIFVMATTEFHKIPATILSRVQSFNFKRANLEDILEYLKKIIASEKISIMPEALHLIAISGDGSYRDATSMLDQVASSRTKNITLEDVESVLGIAGGENVIKFLEALSNHDVKNALNIINQIFVEGYDLGEFNKQLVEYLRRIILYKNNNFFENSELGKEQIESLKKIADKLSLDKTLELINLFINAGLNIKGNNLPQLPLEIAAIKICGTGSENLNKEIEKPKKDIDDISKIKVNAVIVDKKNELEPKLKSKIEIEEKETTKKDNLESKKESNQTKNVAVDTIVLKEKWPSVLSEMGNKNRSLYLILKESEPMKIENNKFTIGIKFKLYAERLNEKKNYQAVAEAIEKVYGKNYPLGFLVNDAIKPAVITEQKTEEKNTPEIANLVNDTLEIFGS